jgi:hypothetical protein
MEDKQERAKKQRLKESLKKKGNFKVAEAVKTGCIPKKDSKCKSTDDSDNKLSGKKPKKGKKYCDWCASHGNEERFIHSHVEEE